MIGDISLFIFLAIGALVLQIVISIASSVYIHKSGPQNKENFKKLSVYAKISAFMIFLVIGFSFVPIAVKFFADFLPDFMKNSPLPQMVKDNGMIIVYVFWGIVLAGLIIAMPAMIKSGFFKPETPEESKE